jgi:glucose-6-phosphate 1-epimerase
LSEILTLSLTTRNLGAVEFSLTQALHSYFRVEEIADLDVLGLKNIPFIDQLEPGALKTDSGPVRITREVDRIYQGVSGPITLKDGAARLIRIEAQGSSSAVLWNPWIEKSARLGDMGEDGYRRMVCVETANAGADVIVLPAHASHTLTAIISASRPGKGVELARAEKEKAHP